VVLSEGEVTASGLASELLLHTNLFPQSGPAETGALIETRVSRHEDAYGLTVLQARAGALTVPRLDLPIGASLKVRLRARDIILSLTPPEDVSALNVLPGTVSSVGEPDGSSIDVMLDCGGDSLVARITRKSAERLRLEPGLAVHAIIKGIAFDREALGSAMPRNM
jgi:molybdate transport system ATP-binding protein